MTTTRTFLLTSFLFTLLLTPSMGLEQSEGVRWRNSIDAAKLEASQSGRLVLLHFWSPSCGPCRKLDKSVFPSEQVAAEVEKNYVPVKVNAAISAAMTYAYKVDRVPSDVILTPNGDVLATYTSPLSQDDYLARLGQVATTANGKSGKSVNLAAVGQGQAAYQELEGSMIQPASTPLSNSASSASRTNGSTLGRDTAKAKSSYPPASQPSQSAYRYSLPTKQEDRIPEQKYPGNVVTPSRYQNPYATSKPPKTPSVDGTTPVIDNGQNVPVASAANFSEKDKTSPVTRPRTSDNQLRLPAGSPSLGFDGYCPISLKFERKWIRGDVQYGAIHRGRTYLFVGDQQRQQFLANPDAYSPVFSGVDPVSLLDKKQIVEGSRKFGFEYRGAFYLFSNADTMQKFSKNPDHYAAGVREAMARHDGTAGVIRK